MAISLNAKPLFFPLEETKNYDKDILLHEDSKLEYLGTLIKEGDELFNDLITKLDVNSNIRNLVNKIPYYELRKETIEENISL